MVEAMDAVREGAGVDIGHSGELETSVILALNPECVRQDRLRLVRGVTDDPSIATADKGRRILEAATEAVAQLLRRLAEKPGREVLGVETYTKS